MTRAPHVYRIGVAFIVGALLAGLGFRVTNDGRTAESVAAAGVPTNGGGPAGAAAASGTSGGTVTGGGPAAGPTAAGPESAGGGAVGTTEAGAAPTGGDGPLTDSDVGVTATTIRIGVAIADSSKLAVFTGGSYGGPTTVDAQRRSWQALIDDVNRSGGVLGRTLEPHFYTLDVTSETDQRAACNDWTETNQVFAVFAMGTLSSFGGAGELCVASEHQTLVLDDTPQLPREFFDRAAGLLINTSSNATRSIADMAYAFEHFGLLGGRTLGLITDQGPGESIAENGLEPALQNLGYSLAYTAVVSSDPSQGPTQAVSHVAQMRSAGVDTVIDATSFVNMSAFASAAQGQGWEPDYLVSEYNGNDLGSFLGAMPRSFDGATVITHLPYDASESHPEDETTRSCREQYNALNGTSYAAGELDITSLRFAVTPCAQLRLFQAVATALGPTLTRQGFTNTLQANAFTSPMNGLGGSWGPGKTDYNDVVRAMVWGSPDGSSSNCSPAGQRCWNDAGPPWNPRTERPA